MKKFSLNIIVIASLIFGLSIPSFAGKVCKFGHVNSPGSIFHYQAVEFKKAVEAQLPDMKVEVYPAGQIGGTLALMQGLQTNTVQIYSEFPYIWEGNVPEFKVLAAHYVFKSLDGYLEFMRSDLFKKEMNDKLVKQGVRIIGNVDSMGTFNFLSKKPIRTMADCKGIKNRCAQMAPLLSSWRSYGAKPTPLDWGEIYTSLATGVIDGLDNPILDMYDEKFNEVCNYINMTGNLYTAIAYNTSETFWQSLNDHEKSVFKMAIEIANLKTKIKLGKTFADAMADMTAHGITVIKTDTSEFKKAVADNIDNILEGNELAISMYKKIQKAGY
jgi:TRAP-type C4-dicarboxylate transport system substrate-binding protein